MSRIVLYGMGYRGDVLPFVPVARELAGRGHQVRFVCPREFHPLFEGEGFSCMHSGTDLGPRLLDEHAQYVARWGSRFGGMLLPRLYLDKLTVPFMDVLFEVIDDELATADLVVSHPFSYLVAGPAAERRGVPAVVLDVLPMLMPSRYARLPVGPRLPRVVQAAGWAVMRSRLTQTVPTFAHLRQFRARLGLDVSDWNFFDAIRSPLCTIGLYSAHYQPRQPDWPDSYQLAGFTPWLGPDNVTLPADVAAFLATGEPPVLITLGTNAASARPELFAAAANAVSAAGARSLILTSNDDIGRRTRAAVGAEHGVWPFVSLGPLLGRCRAVVHAGGHGTNAAVLPAGLPSAIVPAVTDQAWHARRIAQLGVGVHVKRGQLGHAVRALVGDDVLAGTAQALGDRLRAENGPLAAADLVETSLSG